MEDMQKLDEVVGPAGGNGAGANGVLQSEVPADDPGQKLAEGSVSVRVGAAGQGNHRGKLGVTKAREGATQAREHKREHERGACIMRAETRQHKDARADDGADANSRQLRGA